VTLVFGSRSRGGAERPPKPLKVLLLGYAIADRSTASAPQEARITLF
jgi:hypothetical protein